MNVSEDCSDIRRRPQGAMYTGGGDKKRLAPRTRRTRRGGPNPRLGRGHVTTYTPSNSSSPDERAVGGVSKHSISPLMQGLSRHGHSSLLGNITRRLSSSSAKDVFSDTGAADILVTVAKAGDLRRLQGLPEVSQPIRSRMHSVFIAELQVIVTGWTYRLVADMYH